MVFISFIFFLLQRGAPDRQFYFINSRPAERRYTLPPDHVLVELDDGDSRLVEVDKIRMLPSDYSRVGETLPD